jgi:hypothetical protein
MRLLMTDPGIGDVFDLLTQSGLGFKKPGRGYVPNIEVSTSPAEVMLQDFGSHDYSLITL